MLRVKSADATAGQDNAGLANASRAMKAQGEASFASLVPETRRRWDALRLIAIVPLFCATVVVLWMSGYPRWLVASRPRCSSGS